MGAEQSRHSHCGISQDCSVRRDFSGSNGYKLSVSLDSPLYRGAQTAYQKQCTPVLQHTGNDGDLFSGDAAANSASVICSSIFLQSASVFPAAVSRRRGTSERLAFAAPV